MNTIVRLSVIAAISIMLLAGGGCSQQGATPGVAWRWSQSETELYQPRFSPNGREITLVRKRHIPDGHEAELLPQEWRRERFQRIDLDERYADPEVIIAEVGSDRIERIDWGWSPAFSPDVSRIAYARQVKPISRFRILAETLKGNEIRIYDRNQRTAEFVASPEEGYLARPMFSPDGKYLVYSIGGPVNGSYGGDVGLARVSLDSGNRETLSPPFPTGGFQNDQISQSGYVGDQLFALMHKVVDGSKCDCQLVAIGAKPNVVYSWGIRDAFQSTTAFSPGAGGEILIYEEPVRSKRVKGQTTTNNGAWRTIANDTPLYTPSAHEQAPGIPSPNGLLLAISNPSGISVRNLGSGAKVRDWNTSGPVQTIAWSPDSRRLAVIVTKWRDSDAEIFDFDELLVLDP